MLEKRQFIKKALLAAVPVSFASRAVAATADDENQNKILAIITARLGQLKELAGLDGRPGLVSAGKVPGLRTGAHVDQGYLGETISSTYNGPSGIILNNTAGITALILPPGVWLVMASGTFYSGGAPSTAYATLSANGYQGDIRFEGNSDPLAPPTGRYLRWNTGPLYVSTAGGTVYLAVTSTDGSGTTVGYSTVRAIRVG